MKPKKHLELRNWLALLGSRRRRIPVVSAEVPRHEPALDLARGGLGELVGDEDARGDLGRKSGEEFVAKRRKSEGKRVKEEKNETKKTRRRK